MPEDKYGSIIDKAARVYPTVDPNLIRAVKQQENPWDDPTRTSKAGAVGLMQLMPETAKALGVTDSTDPEQNIMGGTKLLAQLLDKYKDPEKALAAYNWREDRLDATLKLHPNDWKNHLPEETTGYLPKVSGYYQKFSGGKVTTNELPQVGIQQSPENPDPPAAMPEGSLITKYRQQNPQYNNFSDDQLMHAIHEEKYSKYPYDSFKQSFMEEYGNPPETTGAIGTFVKGVEGSLGGIAKGIAGIANKVVGKDIFSTGYLNRKEAEVAPDKEIQQSVLEHPELLGNFKWWMYQAGQAAPWVAMMAATEGMGAAVAGGTGEAAGGIAEMVNAGSTATKLLRMGGGGLASSLGISIVNAGNAYNQAQQEGKSDEEASKIADNVLGMSVPVNMIAGSIQAGKMLNTLGKSGQPITDALVSKSLGAIMKDMGESTLTGSAQIAMQTIISNVALDHPWNEGLGESAISGGALGLGLGGAHEMMGALARHGRARIANEIANEKPPAPTTKTGKAEGETVPPPQQVTPGSEQIYGIKLTPEEFAKREGREEAIKNIQDPQIIADETNSIRNQLTNYGKDKESLDALNTLEGMVRARGGDDREVLIKFSHTYADALNDAQREYQVTQTLNEVAPKDAVGIVEHLAFPLPKQEETPAWVKQGLEEKTKANKPTMTQEEIDKEFVGKPPVPPKAEGEKPTEAEAGKKIQEQIISHVPEEQRDALNAVFAGMAKAEGKSVEEFLGSRIGEVKIDVKPGEEARPQTHEEVIKGATQVMDSGKAILHLFTGKLEGTVASDAKTVYHEMFHIGVNHLGPEQITPLERLEGKPLAEWDRATHEKYADMYMDFANGVKVPKVARGVFEKIKDLFYSIYKAFIGSDKAKSQLNINSEVRKVFDSMIDSEMRDKLRSDYHEQASDFLKQYNESPIEGDKKLGFIRDVKPEDRQMILNKLKGYGYQTQEGLDKPVFNSKTQQWESNSDIAYFINKNDKIPQSDTATVKTALDYKLKDESGQVGEKELELLHRAQGIPLIASQMINRARQVAYENFTGEKLPEDMGVTEIGKSVPTSPISASAKFSAENTLASGFEKKSPAQLERERLFGQDVTPGLKTIASGNIIDRETSQLNTKSNRRLLSQAEKLRKDNPELASAIEKVARTADANNPVNSMEEHTFEVPKSVIAEHMDRLMQYSAVNAEIKSTESPTVREKLIEMHSKLLNELSDPANLDFIRAVQADPSYNRFDLEPPMNSDERQDIYDRLFLSKEQGDRKSDIALSNMLATADKTFYQKVGLSEDGEKKVIEVGRLETERRMPLALKGFMKDMSLSRDQLANQWQRLAGFVGLPQVMGLWNEGFGRIWRAIDHFDGVRNEIVAKQLNRPDYIEHTKKSRAFQEETEKILVDGTTYGINEKTGLSAKPKEPWSQDNVKAGKWLTNPKLEDQVAKGLITQEQADQIKATQNQLRSDFVNKRGAWDDAQKKIGKVFTKQEVLDMGYTPEHYDAYIMKREMVDAMVPLWKQSAIANGMSPEDAEKTFSMTGYYPLARNVGRWSLMFKDPTSPTGYSSTRFASYKDADAMRSSMIEKGLIDPNDNRHAVRPVEEQLKLHGKYLSDHDLQGIIDEAGNFTQVKERLKDPNVSEAEKQVLMGQDELRKAILTEWKGRNYAGARTIPRGNVGLVINAEDMKDAFETFIHKTASRYAGAESSAYINSLSAQMNATREGGNETPEAEALRQTWMKYANRYLESTFAYRDPNESKFFSKLRGAGFLWNIGLNVSSAFVHATHTLYTLPSEMYKWSQDVGGNTAMFLRSEVEAVKMAFGGELSQSFISRYPDLPNVIEELKRMGKLKATMSEELAAAHSMPEALRNIVTTPIRKSETKNRISAMLNFYQLAHDSVIDNAKGNEVLAKRMADIYSIPDDEMQRINSKIPYGERGKVFEEYNHQMQDKFMKGELTDTERNRAATQFASHGIDSIQPMFKASNNPGFITSAGWLSQPLKTAFLFKKFADFYVGWLTNAMRTDPTLTAPQNGVHRMLAIAPLLMVAGAAGLPFSQDIRNALRASGVTDVDRHIRELIGDNQISDTVLHGLPGALPGIAPDFSRRAGVGDLAGRVAEGDIGDALVNMFGGAPAQMLKNVTVDAYRDFAAGDYTQAYMKMSPLFVSNLIKTVREANQGLMTTQNQQLISPKDIGAGHLVMQALGVTPMKYTEARELNETMKFSEASAKSTTKGFNERLAQAIAHNDHAKVQEVVDDIVKYDAKIKEPSQLYNLSNELNAIKQRVLEMTNEAAMARIPNKFKAEYQRIKPLYTGTQ